MSDGHKKGPVHFWRRLALEVRPYWSWIGLSFLTSILAAPFSLLLPLPLKIAVDSVIGGRQLPGFLVVALPDRLVISSDGVLLVAVVLVVAIAVLDQLRGFCNTMVTTYAGEQLHSSDFVRDSSAMRSALAFPTMIQRERLTAFTASRTTPIRFSGFCYMP